MYEKKRVLISGASRGVGRLLADHFLSHNATVIGLSRGETTLDHENYFHFQVDLAKPDEIIACFRQIAKIHKSIDILINNAAVATSQYAMIMPVKSAVEMVDVNLLGVFFVSREAAKLMRSNSYGRIVNISSMAVSLEPMGGSLYAACKAGINTLANIMAKEFSSINITCNTLGITAIETDMIKQLSKQKLDEMMSRVIVPRYAKT